MTIFTPAPLHFAARERAVFNFVTSTEKRAVTVKRENKLSTCVMTSFSSTPNEDTLVYQSMLPAYFGGCEVPVRVASLPARSIVSTPERSIEVVSLLGASQFPVPGSLLRDVPAKCLFCAW